ncbi:MAG: CotH kinase family protein [Planctomycetes bacterium]|nr:CotH kinase family protein [Planctomycetota bacterium]
MKLKTWPWALAALAGCILDSDSDSGSDSSPQPPSGSDRTAAELFDESELQEIRLDLPAQDWDAIIQTADKVNYRRATIHWQDVTVEGIGVRAAKDTSNVPGHGKMSLKLEFGAFDLRFLGLKELKLDGMSKDASFMRDRLAYGLFRQVMAAPRSAHCRLFVNGTYWGVYEIEERVDSVLVRDRFAPTTGNLYRIRQWGDGQDQYAWTGPELSNYLPYPWEPETHKDTGDFSDVVTYIDVLNHNPASFGNVADVDALIDYLAVEAIVIDNAGVANFWSPGNHFQYHDPASNRFVIIPWDLDAAWKEAATRDIYLHFEKWKLTSLVLNDSHLDARYRSRIGELIETIAHPDLVLARIDAIYNQIRDAVYSDPHKSWTNEQFEMDVAWIRQLATDRYSNLREQIARP